MGSETMVVGPKRRRRRWGTWEELILGGAVLRHGTQDWDIVASELQTRTLIPYCFTSEACKAKYEDLRKRYSGCSAWFEELRKRRMEELKRELEKSEDSIGSLESKLQRLEAERGHYIQLDYDSSQTESHVPILKSEDIESFGKETSKDGLSAGSFTQDTGTNWLPECQIPVVQSAAEAETKPELVESSEHEKVLGIKMLAETCNVQGGTVRKRTGKRKRKDSNRDGKERSIGDSDNLGSTNVVNKYSTSECGQTVKSSSQNRGLCGMEGSDDLLGIFNSLAESESGQVFRRKLDSQKRARYRKIIRRHMDFETIKSRIASYSIKSAKELFRDLLLLANNALVFYSRRTREYKSALYLRDVVKEAYRQHSENKVSSSTLCISRLYNPPVKPRSVRPRPCKGTLLAKLPNAENVVNGNPQGGYRKLSNGDFNLVVVVAKKSFGRLGRAACVTTSNQRPKTPVKERKRAPQK